MSNDDAFSFFDVDDDMGITRMSSHGGQDADLAEVQPG